ncbi:MAG TPA: hypothetical protein VG405_04145 [Solirubrobacteraceae bacterium]|nr:hypothetical protein [Solirubrobacteraceae bacterium]
MTSPPDRPRPKPVTGRDAAGAGFLMLAVNAVCAGIGAAIGLAIGALVPLLIAGFLIGFGVGMRVVAKRFSAP